VMMNQGVYTLIESGCGAIVLCMHGYGMLQLLDARQYRSEVAVGW
jgi:hypothetical protein